MNVSFGGCGFIGIYHVGVVQCLTEHAPHLLKQQICGTSAGAIIAAGLVQGLSPLELTVRWLSIVNGIRSQTLGALCPSSNLSKLTLSVLNSSLDDDIHIKASNRLHVGVTTMKTSKTKLINQFSSKAELVEAVMGAHFIPYVSGWIPPKYRGESIIDGMWTENRPILNPQTITVSPFSGDSDICPQNRSVQKLVQKGRNISSQHVPNFRVPFTDNELDFSTKNANLLFRTMLPPSPDDLRKICEQGFKDAFRFIVEKKLIYCNDCVQNQRIERYRMRDVETGRLVPRVRNIKCIECAIKMHNVPKEDISLPNDMTKLFETEADAADGRYTTKLMSAVSKPVEVSFKIAKFSFNTFQSAITSPFSTMVAAYDKVMPNWPDDDLLNQPDRSVL